MIKMRKSVFAILAVLAALALMAIPVAAAEEQNSEKVILVSGNGYSTTSPDKVTISFAVETTDPDAKKAQSDNAQAMNNVIAALKSAGITSENIKTTGYNMYSYEIGEYNPGKWPTGTTVYRVSNTITMISYDVNKAGEYVDIAIDAGANNVNRLQFGLSNEKQIVERNKALVSAVKAAKADADSISAALGLKILGTGKIYVDQSYSPVTYTANVNVAMDGAMAKETAAGAPRAAPTTVEMGDLQTTAVVSIAYLY